MTTTLFTPDNHYVFFTVNFRFYEDKFIFKRTSVRFKNLITSLKQRVVILNKPSKTNINGHKKHYTCG